MQWRGCAHRNRLASHSRKLLPQATDGCCLPTLAQLTGCRSAFLNALAAALGSQAVRFGGSRSLPLREPDMALSTKRPRRCCTSGPFRSSGRGYIRRAFRSRASLITAPDLGQELATARHQKDPHSARKRLAASLQLRHQSGAAAQSLTPCASTSRMVSSISAPAAWCLIRRTVESRIGTAAISFIF